MKFSLPAVFLVAAVFVAGCHSLDNPLSGLLGSGHDARVYNSQTGEFEWPKDQKKPQSRVAGLVAPPAAGTPVPERKGDGRYYDTAKGQWVEPPEERSTSSRPKAKPSAPAPSLMTTPVPVGTPPPVRPPRASGVYNPSTGQIEWRDFDPAPRSTPVPAPKKKSWYWPF